MTPREELIRKAVLHSQATQIIREDPAAAGQKPEAQHLRQEADRHEREAARLRAEAEATKEELGA